MILTVTIDMQETDIALLERLYSGAWDDLTPREKQHIRYLRRCLLEQAAAARLARAWLRRETEREAQR